MIFMTEIPFPSCNSLTNFKSLRANIYMQVFFNQLCICVITHSFTSSSTLCWEWHLFVQDSFCEMLCHTALFTWRREATATSEINPLCTRMSLPHTCTQTHRRTQCALGLALQPSLNESVAGWYDWYRWPFGTGMTKQWPQQVSRLQNRNYQSDRWGLDSLHHVLPLQRIFFTVFSSKAAMMRIIVININFVISSGSLHAKEAYMQYVLCKLSWCYVYFMYYLLQLYLSS